MERKLPEGWEWRSLSKVASIGAGNGAPQGDQYFAEGKHNFVRTSDVGREKTTKNLIFSGDKINDLAVEELKLSIWPEKTLLIPKSGASTFLNHRALLGKPSYVSSHLATVIADPEIVDPEYLYYWSQIIDSKHLTNDNNYPSLRLSEIGAAKIPIPPLETQRRIVAILNKAEETRRLRAQADKLFQEMALNIFIEIFGDLSKDPNLWEIKKMDEVTEKITDGEHATPIRAHEGIYLLSARNVQNHDIALEDVDFIGIEEYERISKRIIPERDDILVSCSGTIGRVARVKDNFKFQMVRSVALIRPCKNLINPIFLEYLFDTNFMKNQIERSVNQSSQANLFQGKIQKLLIPIPPMDLQSRYAHIIEKIESMKMMMMESNDNINNLSNNVIQRAFTGELIS